jgi:DNA-directed RNA polymerase specialized sigma24 family protein
MQNFFHASLGGVVGPGVVVIPFDYEQLPEDRRKKVVPIYIEAHDRDGNTIDPVWFEQGVAPISEELTDLARSVLGDKRMVSDIAQPSVHKVWNRHRHNTGRKPYARIWRQALWEARDQAAGGWRERRFRVISRTLDELDREFPERAADPRDYALIYHQRMLLERFEACVREEGLDLMARVCESLELGDKWSEISAKVGIPEDALKRRFYRFRKKFRLLD